MGEWSGQPNKFPSKIWTGLISNGLSSREEALFYSGNGARFPVLGGDRPKLHTIRSGDRWKEGMKIHFVINNRTKDRFQFAPVIECVSVQKIEIKHLSLEPGGKIHPIVWIDGYLFFDAEIDYDAGIEQLALNDGFESVEQFFAYFNTDFVGQIVHWTPLKY